MKKRKSACKKIREPKNQIGGYPKGFKLARAKSPTRDRFERTFTLVLPDGTQIGNFIGMDWEKKKEAQPRLQGTAWITAVKDAFRQNCTAYREQYRIQRIIEDYGLESDDYEGAEKIWKKLVKKGEHTEYQSEAIKLTCPPMVMLLRETTPGNNKWDFSFRERRYWVRSEPVAPVKVTPTRGKIPRVYRYLTKVYPMKKGETVEQLKIRKNLQ